MNNLKFNLSEVAGSKIATQLKNKSGVYQWKNTINGKSYVGSSSDLRRRFLEYLNSKRLKRELDRGESIIYKALLKYGYLSFEFYILDIVKLDPLLTDKQQNDVLKSLEQKYIDEIKPDYNILTFAGSNRGHILSFETRSKMSIAKKGLPSHRKGKVHSLESR